MEKKYFLTEEQFDLIEFYQRMFEVHSERIEKLCNSEKSDIVYGFELGQIYTNMQDYRAGMMELKNEIRKQKIEQEKTNEEWIEKL